MTRKCCLERLQILINMLSYIKLYIYIYNIYGEILSYFAFPWGVNGPSDSCGPRQVNGVTALNVWLTAPNSYRPPRTHSPNPAFTQQTACHTMSYHCHHPLAHSSHFTYSSFCGYFGNRNTPGCMYCGGSSFTVHSASPHFFKSNITKYWGVHSAGLHKLSRSFVFHDQLLQYKSGPNGHRLEQS